MGVLGKFTVRQKRRGGKTPLRSAPPKDAPEKGKSGVAVGKAVLSEKEKFDLCTGLDCKFIEASPHPECYEPMFVEGGQVVRLSSVRHCRRWGVDPFEMREGELLEDVRFKAEGMDLTVPAGTVVKIFPWEEMEDFYVIEYEGDAFSVEKSKIRLVTEGPVPEKVAQEGGKPAKVIEIADAIRRDNPGISDESAYRMAWTTYCTDINPAYEGCKGGYPQAPPATSEKRVTAAHLARGIISAWGGHPMSGLWTISFEDGSQAFLESGYGARNLVSAFGEENIVGQDIYYSVDEIGVMVAFTPASEWTGDPLAVGETTEVDVEAKKVFAQDRSSGFPDFTQEDVAALSDKDLLTLHNAAQEWTKVEPDPAEKQRLSAIYQILHDEAKKRDLAVIAQDVEDETPPPPEPQEGTVEVGDRFYDVEQGLHFVIASVAGDGFSATWLTGVYSGLIFEGKVSVLLGEVDEGNIERTARTIFAQDGADQRGIKEGDQFYDVEKGAEEFSIQVVKGDEYWARWWSGPDMGVMFTGKIPELLKRIDEGSIERLGRKKVFAQDIGGIKEGDKVVFVEEFVLPRTPMLPMVVIPEGAEGVVEEGIPGYWTVRVPAQNQRFNVDESKLRKVGQAIGEFEMHQTVWVTTTWGSIEASIVGTAPEVGEEFYKVVMNPGGESWQTVVPRRNILTSNPFVKEAQAEPYQRWKGELVEEIAWPPDSITPGGAVTVPAGTVLTVTNETENYYTVWHPGHGTAPGLTDLTFLVKKDKIRRIAQAERVLCPRCGEEAEPGDLAPHKDERVAEAYGGYGPSPSTLRGDVCSTCRLRPWGWMLGEGRSVILEKLSQAPEDEIKPPKGTTDRTPGGFSKVMNWSEVQEHEHHSDLYESVEEAQNDLTRFEMTYGVSPAIVFCPDEMGYAILAGLSTKRSQPVFSRVYRMVLDYLNEHDGATPDEIVDGLGIDFLSWDPRGISSVDGVLHGLASEDYVRRDGDRVYLTDKGRTHVVEIA